MADDCTDLHDKYYQQINECMAEDYTALNNKHYQQINEYMPKDCTALNNKHCQQNKMQKKKLLKKIIWDQVYT